MYAPVTPALSTAALSPNGVVATEGTAPPATAVLGEAPPSRTAIRIRRMALNVLDGHAASLTGTLRTMPSSGQSRPAATAAAAADEVVVLQARGRRGWRTLTGARTGARGRFRLRYTVRRLGSERLRVRFAGRAGERASERAAGRLNVYRPVVVSWYGGGGSLACGGWLTSATLGVANRTLPCGTLVTLRYRGRSLRVPVVDRGPYVAGREYDLTEATKRALGFEGVGEMWATS
jgi:rare lipoprotein A